MANSDTTVGQDALEWPANVPGRFVPHFSKDPREWRVIYYGPPVDLSGPGGSAGRYEMGHCAFGGLVMAGDALRLAETLNKQLADQLDRRAADFSRIDALRLANKRLEDQLNRRAADVLDEAEPLDGLALSVAEIEAAHGLVEQACEHLRACWDALDEAALHLGAIEITVGDLTPLADGDPRFRIAPAKPGNPFDRVDFGRWLVAGIGPNLAEDGDLIIYAGSQAWRLVKDADTERMEIFHGRYEAVCTDPDAERYDVIWRGPDRTGCGVLWDRAVVLDDIPRETAEQLAAKLNAEFQAARQGGAA